MNDDQSNEIDRSDNMLSNILDNVSNNVSNNMSDNVSNNMSDNVSNNMSDNVSDNVSNNMSDNVSNNMSDDLSDDVSDNMSNNMSENKSEDLSDDWINQHIQEKFTKEESSIEKMINEIKTQTTDSNTTNKLTDQPFSDQNQAQINISSVLSTQSTQSTKSNKLYVDNMITNRQEYETKWTIAVEKYAPIKYEELKDKMMRCSKNGTNYVCIKGSSTLINFHGVFLAETDLIPLYKQYIDHESIDPNIRVVLQMVHGNQAVMWSRVGKRPDYPIDLIDSEEFAKMPFYTQLVLNVEEFEKDKTKGKTKEEEEFERVAMIVYQFIKKKMESYSQIGKSEVEFNTLHIDQMYIGCLYGYFPLIRRWFYHDFPDLMVWLRRTNSIFTSLGPTYNLAWRRKMSHEKIFDNVYEQVVDKASKYIENK